MKTKTKTCEEEKVFQFMNKSHVLPEETERFQDWILDSNVNQTEKEESLYRFWLGLRVPSAPAEAQRSLEEVKQRLGMTDKAHRVPAKQVRLTKVAYRVAAALLPFVLAVGAYMMYKGEVAKDTSIDLEQIAALQVANTQDGPEKKVLTDGSTVWVNKKSQIAYHQEKKERVVKMSGEAFFEVTKKDKPFVVNTGDLLIKVLGTKFNVEAYPDQDVSVITLLSGAVEITTNNGKRYSLSPNKQLVYQRATGEAEIREIDRQGGTMWTDSWLWIESQTLNSILSELADLYQVRFELDPSVPQNNHLYIVRLNRHDALPHLMDVICAMAGGLNYTIKGDSVVIIKK